MSLDILQRGRAKLSFICSVGIERARTRSAVYDEVKEAVDNGETLPEDLDERAEKIEGLLRHSDNYATYLAVHKWHLSNTTVAAFDAFEENRAALVEELDKGLDGDTELSIDETLVHPEYWKHDFHATTGGYDGHEYMGFIHGELIHKWIVDAAYGGAMFAQRYNATGETPKKGYRRILDMGCGTGYFTLALAKRFPDAEIHGLDCSRRMLEYACRKGNEAGLALKLHHGLNEKSGFPDEHFDLVTSYILLHEIPVEAMNAIFRETFRILEPGGDFMMSDATRYDAMDPVAVWQQDTNAVREIEPYWRETASLDFAEVATAAGFVNVESYGTGPGNYPWIVRGTKPA